MKTSEKGVNHRLELTRVPARPYTCLVDKLDQRCRKSFSEKKKANASEKSKKKLAEISLLIVTLELISYFTYIQLILTAEFSIWKFEQGFLISQFWNYLKFKYLLRSYQPYKKLTVVAINVHLWLSQVL